MPIPPNAAEPWNALPGSVGGVGFPEPLTITEFAQQQTPTHTNTRQSSDDHRSGRTTAISAEAGSRLSRGYASSTRSRRSSDQ